MTSRRKTVVLDNTFRVSEDKALVERVKRAKERLAVEAEDVRVEPTKAKRRN